MNFIPYGKQSIDQDDINVVVATLKSDFLTTGPKVKEFEDKITEYLGVKYAIAVSNCTSALHLALLSFGVKQGDDVLVADFTFPATGHSVLYFGANPGFLDKEL